MTSCSSASLIKLCVVFLLNISWFTTGSAPPLSVLQLQETTSVKAAARTTTTLSPQKSGVRTATITTAPTNRPTSLSETTIDSFSDRNPALTPTPGLSPTTSSHVHVTVADQSLESGTTFSSTKNPSSSLSTFRKSRMRDGESLEGGESSTSTYSTSSLSKKFEELLLFSTSTRITPSTSSSELKMSSNKISQNEISDINGAPTTIIISGGGGSESRSESKRDSSSSSTTSRTTPSTSSTSYLSSSSSSSVPQGVGELSSSLTYSSSSSNFAKDENEQTQSHLESFTTRSIPPEITLSTTTPMRNEDFIPRIYPSLHEKDGKTTRSQPPPPKPSTPLETGSDIITTTTTTGLDQEQQQEQMEFQEEDYYETVDEKGTLSAGIIFDRDYTPEEIAQYIFLTGDERGVASTINDLINDGLMLSREETIKFLTAVKAHLTELRIRYEKFLIESGMEDDAENENNSAEPEESSSFGDRILEIKKNNGMMSSENGNESSSENIFT